MVFVPNFTSSDLPVIIIDVIGSGFVAVLAFIGLIVLLIILGFIAKALRDLVNVGFGARRR